ncbi:hypothetical protein AB870_05090 [Pandoraea faecigallinarum]|uniref:Uncharacterized protein n=2 Tax=Pandoraea faecigallinarum TaxID=656179 RepID=A0A0H3WQ13_9BURK|nr:hypothetical protein AB870_05090 [Pandoraea faecigallinarum]
MVLLVLAGGAHMAQTAHAQTAKVAKVAKVAEVAQTAPVSPPHRTTRQDATPHAIPHAAPHTAPHTAPHAAPRTASGAGASSPSADAATSPALPRLIAITPQDNDDIARFALYAARDIEQLGLQFPAHASNAGNASPDTEVVITMSLRDGATSRMRDFSRQHMNEPMTLIVDGVEMLTATIRSELGGKFQLQLPKDKARLLFQRVLAKAGPAT